MRLYPFLSDCLKKVGKLTKEYSNLPDSYIRRSMEQVQWRTPRGYPMYLPRTMGVKRFKFGMYRPWEAKFAKINHAASRNNEYIVEPVIWTIYNGDRVEILVGPDKGKQGTVCQIFEERNWVIVEGLNMKLKKIERDDKPLYLQEEKPLVVNRQVALVDPVDLKPCKVEWRYTEDGTKVRVSMRSGRIIPMPKKAQETYDYKARNLYQEADKDTRDSEIVKITHEPQLKTFEMDIMDQMGIKDDRVPLPTYWY